MTAFGRGTLDSTRASFVPNTANHTQAWTLDALGNWKQFTSDMSIQSRQNNQQNELTQINSANLGFDNNGNTTTDDHGNQLTYDAWNRLVSVTTGGMPPATLTGYSYDALGRRIQEVETNSFGDAVTRDLYFSAQWQVLEERETKTGTYTNLVRAQYVWSPVYVDAMVERDRDPAQNGSGALSERFYVQQGANWNVTALVDTTGTVQERFIYDPYGRPTDATGQNIGALTRDWTTKTGGDSYGWVYLHQGGRYDAISGLYNFRERDYSPTLGRWMQLDPISYQSGDYDLYRYDKDNPTTYLDPWGLKGGHHWFPQALESKIAAKCPTIRIHDFASPEVNVGIPLPGFTQQTVNVGLATQKNPPSIHYYLTHGFHYNDRFVKDVLNKSKDCCDLLQRAFALMLEALAEVGARFFNGSIVTTNFVSYTGTQNTDAKFSAYVTTGCCKSKPKPLPAPEPAPAPKPVPNEPSVIPTPGFPWWLFPIPGPAIGPKAVPALPVWPIFPIPKDFFDPDAPWRRGHGTAA